MKNISRPAFAFLALFIVSCAGGPDPAQSSWYFRIRDVDGRPVHGAALRLAGSDGIWESDAWGKIVVAFSVSEREIPDAYQVSAPGYITLRRSVSHEPGGMDRLFAVELRTEADVLSEAFNYARNGNLRGALNLLASLPAENRVSDSYIFLASACFLLNGESDRALALAGALASPDRWSQELISLIRERREPQ
jgi:hypothetical protein